MPTPKPRISSTTSTVLEQTLSERVAELEQAIYGKLSPQSTPRQPLPPLLGNPSPLGLLAFATASLLTAVIKISSNQLADTTGTFAATAIFFGGLAQLLSAIFEILQNKTHAATAFGLYGFHWLTVGFQIWVTSTSAEEFVTTHALPSATYSGVLAVMSVLLFIPTLRMNAVLSALFIALTLVFVTEIPAAYGVRAAEIASGIIQGIAGALGAYLALLDLVNESWHRQVLPIFAHNVNKSHYEAGYQGTYVPKKSYHKSAVSSLDLTLQLG